VNIFVLDADPQKAAQYHCDKHVVKMVLETAQLLSNCIPNEPERGSRTTYQYTCTQRSELHHDVTCPQPPIHTKQCVKTNHSTDI
jgi:hypothetical protein